jgi:hypothetical protein
LTAAAIAIAVAVGLLGCGGGARSRAATGPQATGTGTQTAGVAPVQIVPQGSLAAGSAAAVVRRPLPAPAARSAVSFDVHLSPDSRLKLALGSGPATIVLRRNAGASTTLLTRGRSYALAGRPGWHGAGWRHVEVGGGVLSIDGQSFPATVGGAAPTPVPMLTMRVTRGRALLQALIISAGSDRASLLLHRLAELHARTPPRRFPVGAGLGDRLYDNSTWTSGFWAGALWQAAALAPSGGMFERWALAATVDHFGQERSDTHDVGFMYGESSLAAWNALCSPGRGGRLAAASLCNRLKRSVLSAADELRALAASNPGAGTIPTNSRSGDTIIDSMMNIAILPFAARMTGNPAYDRLASHHAHAVASLLVRANGSTSQSVNFDPATGRVLSISTHQGISSTSTWSRGEGWAVYGFSQAASDLRDRALLRIALRIAGYIARTLPAGGIPRWDYDAPAGAPLDVSAGTITAAGLLHLAAACRSLPGVCGNPGRWVSLAHRMLTAALRLDGTRPPLGFLGSQALDEHVRGCWCNGGELIFGLTYALEALRLEQGSAG